MKRSIRHRRLASGIVAAAAAATMPLAPRLTPHRPLPMCPRPSTSRTVTRSSWPSTPSACRSTLATPSRPSTPGRWSLHERPSTTPRVSAVGTHFGGPTWQARDGSAVRGRRVDGVTVDPTAIPWLLIVGGLAPGPDGDRLTHTSFIQRTATTGGLPPARRVQRQHHR